MRPRKKGQQYEICYRCPGYTKPIYERFPTYEAANLRIAQIEYEKSIGEFHPPKQTPIQTKRAQKKFITVSELLDEYVQVYGLNHWGDSFLSCNLHRIEHYIKPYLGNVAVKDLTTHDLDLFYDSLQDKPAVVLKGHKKTDACVSRSVIEKTHALLRSALNQAVIWEYIPSNPALRVTLPKYQPQERTVWSASEAQTALDACSDPVLKLCMLLALGCSMRVGEMLGLTWDCIDFATGIISVEKQMQLHQEKGSKGYELVSPKNGRSRTIAAAQTVLARLQQQRRWQMQQKLLLGSDWQNPEGLVFTNEFGTHLTKPTVYREYKRIVAAIGCPNARFHDLRHSYAVAAIRAGDDIKTVQGNLGHATAAFTLDVYGHVTDQMKRESADRMERFIRTVSAG